MLTLELLCERRIQEAIDRGELGDLPGMGHPLELDDDTLVAPELRMAYRILKNAGMLPREIEAVRDVAQLERAAWAGSDMSDVERRRAARRLEILLARIEQHGGGPAPAWIASYHEQIIDRWTQRRP